MFGNCERSRMQYLTKHLRRKLICEHAHGCPGALALIIGRFRRCADIGHVVIFRSIAFISDRTLLTLQKS